MTLPVIENWPLDKHVVSEILVDSNNIGTLFLFSGSEKSSNSPFSIAILVFSGSSKISLSGRPTKSSE